MSLIEVEKAQGPELTERDPRSNRKKSDDSLSITALCLLPDKYDLNHANKDPLTPRRSSSSNSFTWDTRSKALDKSN